MINNILHFIILFPIKLMLLFFTNIYNFIKKIIFKLLKKNKNNINNKQINYLQGLKINKTTTLGLTEIDKLDGFQFEYFVADLLRKLNYKNVIVTPASGDYGIDVLCEKDNVKYAIQCKNYNNILDNKPIQEAYSGMQYYNCHVGVVITNNYFTTHAKELANKNGVLLWDRAKLEEMIDNANNIKIEEDLIIDDIPDEPLFNDIIGFMLNTNVISSSLIQRKFNIGYERAERLMKYFEDKGMISSFNGSNPRKVLIRKE